MDRLFDAWWEENAKAMQSVMRAVWDSCAAEMMRLRDENTQLRAENDKLRTALVIKQGEM